MSWLLGALLTVALIYASICLFCYIFQERFIFIRYHAGGHGRYRFGGPYTEEWLERDDARLHALRFPAVEARGVVLYFHGNAGGLKRWGRLAARFTQHGYEVLMPDPRGYGKSRGRLSEEALISDAMAWYDRLREQWPEEAIVLHGRSLGAALAIPVAAERSPRMLLLETPFANLADVARSYFPFIPFRWLLRYPFRNDERVRGVRCPIYIFHGRRDQVVPYSSALKLYASIPANTHRELFTFPTGRHNDLYKFDRFRELLRTLLMDGRSA